MTKKISHIVDKEDLLSSLDTYIKQRENLLKIENENAFEEAKKVFEELSKKENIEDSIKTALEKEKKEEEQKRNEENERRERFIANIKSSKLFIFIKKINSFVKIWFEKRKNKPKF